MRIAMRNREKRRYGQEQKRQRGKTQQTGNLLLLDASTEIYMDWRPGTYNCS